MLRPPRNPLLALLLVPVALAASAAPSDVAAQAPDPAARGLDLFVDMPSRSAPGATLPVQIQAFGFPTAVTLAPLAGAAIEAVWDPETLGKGVSQAPPAVKATTDAAGRVHLEVPVPEGGEASLRLLLGVKLGEHHRTLEVSVTRLPARELSLIVPDDRVVPGGATSAWAIVKNTTTGEPAANEEVVFDLMEGGLARVTRRATTDAAGTAMVRVPIPWTEDPAFQWKLVARSRSAPAPAPGVRPGRETSTVVLSLREETPGTPKLVASFGEEHVLPGDRVGFALTLRDASGKPVTGAGVRYWIGPKGTDPPSAKDAKGAWERASTAATTDAAGQVKATADAPGTVRKGTATSLRLVAHGELFGHALSADAMVEVSLPLPRVTVIPEIGQVVPGVEQGLVVRVRDARDKAVAGTFVVEADGLSERVTTNSQGEADVTWKVPRDVGAARQIGPCAGGVAATVSVRPTAALAALGNRTEPFSTCLTVNRELGGLVRSSSPMVVAGGAVKVRVVEAAGEKTAKAEKGAGARVWSVRTAPESGGARTASGWMEDVGRGLELGLPSSTAGTWRIDGAAPSSTQRAKIAAGRVLVAPRITPRITAVIAGGRPAPLGTVEIDVDVTDGKGHGLPGSVAAILVDAFGGGDVEGLQRLDTRRGLCRTLGVEREECDPFFDDAGAETLRRRVLGEQSLRSASPEHDPGGSAKEELRNEFKRVLLSLEGAVMDATAQPDSLRDAFRKEKGGNTFNPELMSLVTAAMDPAPLTPGGEPIALGDLVALDRQVTYDNVARRVARLKMFRVLAAVRDYRQSRSLDPDEPVLRDPNAILRRLTTSAQMSSQDLLDPWGGTMAFVKSTGARMPFVNVKGFELRSPGPDGKLGTGDDVTNPFERVVASGTPYAQAMDEDRLVDSALDMEVSQPTVDAWLAVLEELTGTTLGGQVGGSFGAGGIGLGGGGGGGRGYGTLATRGGTGIATGAAFWQPPQRTDDKGHLRLHVPLGDVETTWRLAVVGAPDGATPAVTTLDIASALPLSARVEAGAAWIAGDEADVVITVRNRTASAAKVELGIAAGGAAELASAGDKARTVEVGAGGAVAVAVRVRAPATGTATLDVVAKGPGGLTDRTTHSWDVRPAGELVDMISTQWVEGSAVLALSQVGAGLKPIGTARLVLERGNGAAIEAALDGLEPDKIASMDGLTYAAEAASRIERWATARRGASDPLTLRAGDVLHRAEGRFLVRKEAKWPERTWSAQLRALRWAPSDMLEMFGDPVECPPDAAPDLAEGLEALEAEPPASNGTVNACWDSLVSAMVAKIGESGDRVALARAVLALAERPHRAASAAALADKLRAWTQVRASGGVTLPAEVTRDRAGRATVFAALLRAAAIGKPSVATPERLAAWLRVQRDAQGSYGSPYATLAAVRALLGAPAEAEAATKVTVVAEGIRKDIEVRAGTTVELSLGAKPVRVELASTGPGLVARLLRPGVRSWSNPPDASASQIAFAVTWPELPKVNMKDVLRVSLSTSAGRPLNADVRIPLPPGATLAEGGGVARQIQGQLVLRTVLDAAGTETLLELPIRFGLAGRFTVPEARARPTYEEGVRAIAPSRPLRVQ